MEFISRLLGVGKKEPVDAFGALRAAGAVDILMAKGLALQKHDPTVMIAITRSNISEAVMVQLHCGLQKRPYLTSSWWESCGVAVESFARKDGITPPAVRFTDGMSWNYLRYLTEESGKRLLDSRRDKLKRGEPELLVEEFPRLSLDYQIELALKVASLQADFRFGEGPLSERTILRNDDDHRVLLAPLRFRS